MGLMNLNEYQELAARTIPEDLTGDRLLLNAILGVNGEAGEMADDYKKAEFQGHPYEEDKAIKELGDILWYVAAGCTALGIRLEWVAEKNVEKLRQRYPDGFSEERSINREE